MLLSVSGLPLLNFRTRNFGVCYCPFSSIHLPNFSECFHTILHSLLGDAQTQIICYSCHNLLASADSPSSWNLCLFLQKIRESGVTKSRDSNTVIHDQLQWMRNMFPKFCRRREDSSSAMLIKTYFPWDMHNRMG